MALSKVDLANQVENQLPQNLVANNLPFRNIIINGDMSIAQRGTSASGITGGGYFTIDRFQNGANGLGTWTQSQSTDVPTGQGFAYSLKYDCTVADASPAGSDILFVRQQLEGQNLQYLKKGTANAESITASFWVKSNKTGTYILELFDNDNSRQISKSYTIDSASTWEKKIITFAGDTTGAFDNDNEKSLDVTFFLGAGSNYTSGTLATSWQTYDATDRAVGQVNLADNTANEWYITGVQLEAGTTASDFEFLPFDVNYSRCNRYYQDYTEGNTIIRGYGYNTSAGMDTPFTFKTPMRAAPTMTEVSGTDGGSNTTLTNFGAIKTYGCDFNTDPTTSNQTNFYSFKFTADAEL
jgi:hypothetical protein